ncbi:RNA methyltransferase, TrmH family, group 3 [Fusobacterium necrophorum subsp. funduliforme ATCC 51357]|uniref:23S rRNA (Guanosine(2251)-2'-O)-methyltransferase RlmB n=1 Tax=Fusobacterium necrophorum subsp. funduliforme TaxID=143387 RepID=A0A170MX73_9FUSO|nr:23S rRNA (guanosine(2251)-2'-O)-methyltransferase RlmB [Fusobacterium necrophorum]AYV92219.1 23S rRNA (guanosine(2251)-2'-O)-methyltransferase RlmB [Fusobacterium necrophorum subsp. funduliforme]EIJ73021.1 RNA methyltransferase, TrmH family, group 3 [Fusobacterium necrophorum subsp. funduliforme ATCC 51357]KAB0552340.1 23S rRNA (guanosine(2251)-2'-O)-methyltransferase RlmB [Fusobacterium necrophorum subsp. funduliforme]KYL05007.1 23S rRNA (guanosine(2251)-2'-O)-methyltransferase RlmB [Fusoba
MERVIGVNPVLEVLNNREKTIEKLEVYKGVRGEILQKIQRLASERNVKIFYTNKKVENSQGFCIFLTDYDYYQDFNEFLERMAGRSQSILLMLDEIQDPRNFGALIRSAEVFGVDGILIPERNSVRINETVVKTSTGAIEYVPIIKVTNLSNAIEKLKKIDYWVYGAAGEAELSCQEEQYPKKVVLILGNEGTGLRKKVREHCDKLIKIQMRGKINSLNVSVAGGILLSEIAKFQKWK